MTIEDNLTTLDQALQNYGVACWAYYTAVGDHKLSPFVADYRQGMLTQKNNLLQYVKDNFLRKHK